jgi:hypothetical protein
MSAKVDSASLSEGGSPPDLTGERPLPCPTCNSEVYMLLDGTPRGRYVGHFNHAKVTYVALSSPRAPESTPDTSWIEAARQDVRDAITEPGPTGVYDKHYAATFPKVKAEADAHEVACFAVFLAGMGAARAEAKAKSALSSREQPQDGT